MQNCDTPRPAQRPLTQTPDSWIERYAPLVPAAGRVLDLACGLGRHTRLFLELGHPVTAVDIDITAVSELEPKTHLEVIEANLEGGAPWPLHGRRFAGIVVCNYLFRPLFPILAEALEPGGVLLYATFARGNELYGRPANPDHLLKPNELIGAFSQHLTILSYEHGTVTEPRPAVRQKICARRETSE